MLKQLTSFALISTFVTAAYASPELLPKIFRADTTADLTITVPEMTPENAAKYRVLYIREDGAFTDGTQGSYNRFEVMTPTANPDTKALKLPGVKMRGEGLHTMRVVLDDGKTTNVTNWKVVGKVTAYSLKDDLFALRPYKGDFHAHSKEGSDGTGTARSVYAYARSDGQDFQTLSDHSTYGSSVKGCEAVNKLNSGLLCLRGEELHAPGTGLHCVSVDADKSVAVWTRANKEKFEELVKTQEKEITNPNLTDYDRRGVAAAEVTFKLAREAGAKLVIYSHPYWMPNDRYNAPSDYNREVFDRLKFDAVECPNGTDVQQAMMIVADKARLAEEGKKLSVVGVTDTHNAPKQKFHDRCTVVFAKELTAQAITDAVKQYKSVATVGAYGEKNEKPLYIGDSRLVRLCYFLGKEYFPEHDKICKEQGELMLKAVEKDAHTETLTSITALRDTLNAYTNTVWAK